MIELGPTYPKGVLGRLLRLGSALARESRPVDHLVSPLRRPLDRAWYRRIGRLHELGELGESVSRVAPAPNGKRVLVLSLRMWTHHTAYESVIAQALRLRGADVAMLTCGGGQPICEVGWGRRVAPRPCDRCAYFTERVARRGRFPLLRLADEFPWGASPAQAPTEPDGSPRLGASDPTFPSVAWFTKSRDVMHLPDGAAVARDFGVSAAAVEAGFGRIVDRFRPDVVFAVNGLFAAERAVRTAASQRGVRVVTYELGPRKGTLLYGTASAAADMAMDALSEDQRSKPLTPAENRALDEMLLARVAGGSAHERYFREQKHSAEAVRASLGVPPGRRVLAAFTNLEWDTALIGKDVAFESQFDWLARACEIVTGRNDAVLVIRVHPAESRWGTAQPVERELARRVGRLPDNVILIGPDDPLSSYGLVETSDVVLCYTSTVGLEAAVRGVPVAVAGLTHYRGRGFTIDIDTAAELESALAEPQRTAPSQVELARRHAFAFFFRLMIPFGQIRGDGHRLTLVAKTGDDLLPGRDPYLDFVCDRILEGGDIVLPSSLVLPSA